MMVSSTFIRSCLTRKNWCFWTVVLERTLESPMDCKEIQPVHSKGAQSWVFFGRNDAKAETPVLWPPHVKSWLIGTDSGAGRDWGQEEKDEMARWHHWLNGGEFEWTLEVGIGQGSLACCGSWGHKESDTTEWLNWIEHYWSLSGQAILMGIRYEGSSWVLVLYSILKGAAEPQQQNTGDESQITRN